MNPFWCGVDTVFHVSSDDLNAKNFFKKVRKKEEEMYVQRELRKQELKYVKSLVVYKNEL